MGHITLTLEVTDETYTYLLDQTIERKKTKSEIVSDILHNAAVMAQADKAMEAVRSGKADTPSMREWWEERKQNMTPQEKFQLTNIKTSGW